MSMWTAIVLIVIAGIAGQAISSHYESKKTKASDEELEALRKRVAEVENLRERVETLERIVTDRREDLRRKFDHLDKAV